MQFELSGDKLHQSSAEKLYDPEKVLSRKPEPSVNPGTQFLKPGDKFPQRSKPGASPEQTRTETGAKMGWNPVDETQDPARILAKPGSTRLVKQEPRVNPEQKKFTLRVSETGCCWVHPLRQGFLFSYCSIVHQTVSYIGK